jgi:hypothetical protein
MPYPKGVVYERRNEWGRVRRPATLALLCLCLAIGSFGVLLLTVHHASNNDIVSLIGISRQQIEHVWEWEVERGHHPSWVSGELKGLYTRFDTEHV